MADWRSDDRELMARALMAEAGNQGPTGMLATGNVILNRVSSGKYGEGIRGVILKPGQFSPFNSVTKYLRGEQGQDIDAIQPTPTAYMVADSLLAGDAGDITGGATHFYNPDISNPSWAEGKEATRIGDHLFLKADDPQALMRTTSSEELLRGGAAPVESSLRPVARPDQEAENKSFLDNLPSALAYMDLAGVGQPFEVARVQDPGIRRQPASQRRDPLKQLGLASLV
jgi:hypothetical protein